MTVAAVALLLTAAAGLVKACSMAYNAYRRWNDDDEAIRPMKPKPQKRPLDDDAWTR